MAKIDIPRSKTDQFRQGSEVVISRSGTSTCPVSMVERTCLWLEWIQLMSGSCLGESLIPKWARSCALQVTILSMLKSIQDA